jgi:hypothetical protein
VGELRGNYLEPGKLVDCQSQLIRFDPKKLLKDSPGSERLCNPAGGGFHPGTGRVYYALPGHFFPKSKTIDSRPTNQTLLTRALVDLNTDVSRDPMFRSLTVIDAKTGAKLTKQQLKTILDSGAHLTAVRAP